MTTTQTFTAITTTGALILSLGFVQLLVLRRGWRTQTGLALLQFVISLVLLQSLVLVIQIGLAVGLADHMVETAANLTVACTLFITLTALALLLHASNAMKETWEIASRSGTIGLLVLQPAIWYRDMLRFSRPLEASLVSSPYTNLGYVVAAVCLGYLLLSLWVAWRFWRQIDSTLLTGAVLIIIVCQGLELLYSPLRGVNLTGLAGGLVSSALGYYFLVQFDTDPQISQGAWLKIARHIAYILASDEDLDHTLSKLAEQAQRLLRTDTINVLQTIGPDRLKVIATAGTGLSPSLGRQIRSGEGLAGRVMQTLYPMRVENYRTWEGKAANFDDLPIHASMSVPLIHNSKLIGVINASETTPGRAFTDRDQQTLELIAPQIASAIVTAQLEHDLVLTRAYLQTVWDQAPTAMFIFDSHGIVRETNATAQQYLRQLFGTGTPSAVELAAQASTSALTTALTHWMADPTTRHDLDTAYDTLGKLHVELQAILNEQVGHPDLLIVMQPVE